MLDQSKLQGHKYLKQLDSEWERWVECEKNIYKQKKHILRHHVIWTLYHNLELSILKV
jgi:hypothetical protein